MFCLYTWLRTDDGSQVSTLKVVPLTPSGRLWVTSRWGVVGL